MPIHRKADNDDAHVYDDDDDDNEDDDNDVRTVIRYLECEIIFEIKSVAGNNQRETRMLHEISIAVRNG